MGQSPNPHRHPIGGPYLFKRALVRRNRRTPTPPTSRERKCACTLPDCWVHFEEDASRCNLWGRFPLLHVLGGAPILVCGGCRKGMLRTKLWEPVRRASMRDGAATDVQRAILAAGAGQHACTTCGESTDAPGLCPVCAFRSPITDAERDAMRRGAAVRTEGEAS